MKFIFLLIMFVNSIFAKQIVVGVGLSLAPYVFPQNDSGIELDILREALKEESNDTISVKYLPLLRIPFALTTKKIDAATTINENSGLKNVFYSDTHIVYQNVIVSLKSKNLHISKISDLQNLKVIGFQNAKKYLGIEYKNIIPKMKYYQELASQMLQVKLLFAKRVDAIALDINIFKYIRKNLKDVNASQRVNISSVFGKTYYKVAFVDKDTCDIFNKGLKKIKQSGRYKEIFDKYIK